MQITVLSADLAGTLPVLDAAQPFVIEICGIGLSSAGLCCRHTPACAHVFASARVPAHTCGGMCRQSFAQQLSISRAGGGGDTPSPAPQTPPLPPPLTWLGQNFRRAFGQSKFSLAPLAQLRLGQQISSAPSTNSGSPAGGCPPTAPPPSPLLDPSPTPYQNSGHACVPVCVCAGASLDPPAHAGAVGVRG